MWLVVREGVSVRITVTQKGASVRPQQRQQRESVRVRETSVRNTAVQECKKLIKEHECAEHHERKTNKCADHNRERRRQPSNEAQ